MIPLFLLVAATGFLAFSNGSNDNFKGVATLYGAGVTSYRTAIAWATAATAAGLIVSLFLAAALLQKFTGKGLTSDTLAGTMSFLLAVSAGAGATVILATRLGLPISTTHGLIGAMIGVGWAALGPGGVRLTGLGGGFLLPLLLSPVLAMALGAVLYALWRLWRGVLGVANPVCVCVDLEPTPVSVAGGTMAMAPSLASPAVTIARCQVAECAPTPAPRVLGIDSTKVTDGLHFLSAGVVSFARGLNDTPKMAALLLVAKWISPAWSVALVAFAIAAGGLIAARRVGETMSHKITALDPEHGLTANLGTGVLVILASLFGLPVSTTHVAVGSLFGVGLATGRADFRTAAGIALSWFVTLPCAAAIGAVVFAVARATIA